jgi:hypothetical protein
MPTKPGKFRVNDAAHLTGVPFRTIQAWVKRGLVPPEGGGGARGKHHTFSAGDIMEIAMVGALRQHGLASVGRACEVAAEVMRRTMAPGDGGHLVSRSDAVAYFTASEITVAHRADPVPTFKGGWIAFDVGQVYKDVCSRMGHAQA